MTKQCPVCATEDEKLIRECQLRGVIPACLGGCRTGYMPGELRQEDERVASDE